MKPSVAGFFFVVRFLITDGKESDCSAGDPDLIPGKGRSPGEGNSNPLQYCLGNSMDRGAWWAKDGGVEKSQTGLSNSHFLSISLVVPPFKFLILSWFSLGRSNVARIYPFLLGCPICWYIIVYSTYHNFFYLYGITYNDSLLSSSFEIFLSLLYLGKCVSILFSFSKQH